MADNPTVPTTSTADPPQQLLAAEHGQGDDDDDSAFGGDDVASSTASLSSSIFEYRTIHGRTFHSERHGANYFTPNDDRQSESVDITHHYLTVLLGGKLHLAPIKDDVQKVVDVGTGTGIWAIDFADAHPGAQVTGTDLSPMQPSWVPPNVEFQIDDATMPWTWQDDTFDFIHVRYLAGAIKDWPAFFREAYRCCKPGGWIESCECDPRFYCDDGTVDKESEKTLTTWAAVFEDGGKKLGNSLTVVRDNVQEIGITEAGFKDIKAVTYKCPVGPWTRDARLADVGRFVQLTLENDMEGYTLFLWTNVLGWSRDEHQIFMMSLRKILRNRRIHIYFNTRYVYGRKPA